jgi:hypothetical protein
MQSLHALLTRRWAQMEAPPESLHSLLRRLCSQMEVPPQSLHSLLCRLCSQMEVPPQSLHWALTRLCSQMEAPPQSLHLLLTRLCSQMEAPPQSLHWFLIRLCGHFFLGCVVLALFCFLCVSGSSRPLSSSPAASPWPRHSRHLLFEHLARHAGTPAHARNSLDGQQAQHHEVCVFYYCRTYYKAVRVGGGGEWRICAMRDDEPRPVWMSLLITH